jgi:hypothetical protein
MTVPEHCECPRSCGGNSNPYIRYAECVALVPFSHEVDPMNPQPLLAQR